MNLDIDRIIDTINNTWEASGQTIVLAGMTIAFILSVIAIWRAAKIVKTKTAGTPADTIVSTLVTAMILALSAEGMYMVLTTKLDNPIPAYLAWAVCAVVEGLLVVLFREAQKFNKTHGRPGPYGIAFWIVAAAGGAIVALSTTSLVEVFLRLALPLSVAMLHWIKLTANSGKANKVTWLITPTRLLARLGWLTGEEETLTEAQVKRQIRKITRAAYLYSSKKGGSRGRRVAIESLRKMMLDATPEIAEAVEQQIRLTYGMEHRIVGAMLEGQRLMDAITGQQNSDQQTDDQPALPYVFAPIEQPTRNGHKPSEMVMTSANILPSLSSGQSAASEQLPTATRQALPSRTNADRDARDTAMMIKYHDVFAKLRANGLLNRSQIERACAAGGDKVLARQAIRLLNRMLAELAELDGEA